MRTIFYQYQSQNFEFLSDNGVFSKDRIDYGSRLLIDTILKEEKRTNLKILDVGCGYGFLGIVLGSILDSRVSFCDVNKRALHLTDLNIEKNKIRGTSILSDGYENITDTYDLIVTNPPIRAGKETVLKILVRAKEHLTEQGILWFVIRKDQGAKSIQKIVEKDGICEIVEKRKGFFIFKAKFS